MGCFFCGEEDAQIRAAKARFFAISQSLSVLSLVEEEMFHIQLELLKLRLEQLRTLHEERC